MVRSYLCIDSLIDTVALIFVVDSFDRHLKAGGRLNISNSTAPKPKSTSGVR